MDMIRRGEWDRGEHADKVPGEVLAKEKALSGNLITASKEKGFFFNS